MLGIERISQEVWVEPKLMATIETSVPIIGENFQAYLKRRKQPVPVYQCIACNGKNAAVTKSTSVAEFLSAGFRIDVIGRLQLRE